MSFVGTDVVLSIMVCIIDPECPIRKIAPVKSADNMGELRREKRNATKMRRITSRLLKKSATRA